MANQQFELLTTAGYIEYFSDLADQTTFIDTFYYTYNEFTSKAKTNRTGTVMVLEPYTNSISENQNDNTLARREGFFAILQQANSPADFPQVQGECELLCYALMGQIKRDSREFKLRAPISNWRGSEVTPISSVKYVGYAIEFTFEAPINRFMAKNPEHWK